ncbi:MAG TPA: transcriptional repressor [Clostridiales bacterium]|nr:transcriptional repressor [Clostridiales bacterium]
MKQQRNTKQRQMILDAVQTRLDHPTADQIYLDVRTIDKRISRGTVYRNLNVLTGQGKISHVKLPQTDRFEADAKLHYHLICTKCGAVCDAPLPYQKELDEMASAHTDYQILRHRTFFEGICPACQKKKD